MKKLYFLLWVTLVCVNLEAQTFSDPNFTAIPVGSGWNSPVGAVFSKNGQKLFVWERGGKVYVCRRDSSGNYIKQAVPVADMSEEVADWDAQGMLGFTVDPNFDTNGLIYLMYVVDRHHLLTFGTPAYDPGTTITGQATIARVTRYQTFLNGSNLVINPATRSILIGESKTTGMPITHHSHGTGSLAFAADGTLLVTMGDGASYEGLDGGSNPGTFYQQALADGIIRPAENVGAFRAQLVNCMNGKLLRIDPKTGDGVPSNPFYSPAEPRAPKSRVWALGLRNAFRIFVKPGTGSTDPSVGDIGEVYIGDVGFATWEEINICKSPGSNFGWPIYEGNEYTIPPDDNSGILYNDLKVENLDEPNPLYGTGGCTRQYLYFSELIRQANPEDNKTIFNPCNSTVPIGTGIRYYHRRPALEWSHAHPWARVGIYEGNTPSVAMIGSPESQVVGTPFAGQCSIGGVVYTGNNFPAQYKNSYFQADFVAGWIKKINIDFTDVVTRVEDFATNFSEIVCIAQNPIDGTLVTVQLGTGVKRIAYGGNQPPVAKLSASKTFGVSPLSVNFAGGTSFDPSPGGSIVSYSWNFGGATPATSNVANPANIVFTDTTGKPKKFVVRLTVTDNGGASHTDSVIVSVNNTPPVVKITSPIKNSLYKQGPDTMYACTATVTDAQHSGSQLKYEWQKILRHNNHEHRDGIVEAVSTKTLIQRVGFYGTDVYYWLIELKVTDAAGLSTKDSAKIFPDRSVASDVTPPLVSTVTPINGATGISISTPLIATFNENIDTSSVNATTFQLKKGNTIVATTLTKTAKQITLRPTAALSGSTVYSGTLKGGASGIKDLAGNPLASDFTWSFTTIAIDNTRPTVSSVEPLAGSVGVSTGTLVTAHFSEAVNPASVTNTTFQLKNSANTIIAATVSAAGSQIILSPAVTLTNSTTYTVTVLGGASGIKDLAGNTLAANYTWTFTTAAVTPVSYSIFPSTAAPAVPLNNDAQGIALGMKFRSAQNGFIRGVRYYKAVGATGTHTGHLWSAAGALLGSTTFAGDTASGWQQALFALPIAINANTTYVVSVFSPSGDYSATKPYFTQAVINDPLRALADGEDGPNGLYSYSAVSVFPTSSFNASNYWVDLVFTHQGPVVSPVVTVQPSSQTRCAGTNATFITAGNGDPVPTVQWQVSTNGTTWTDIAGATNATLTFTTTIADANKRYRAVWTNAGGSATSAAAILTINAIPATPGITLTNNCENSLLTATGTTGTLLWSTGAVTPSITVSTAGTYTVKQTVSGCASATASAVAAPKIKPVLSGNLSATTTSGTAYAYIASSITTGTTFAWTRAAVTGISNAATSGTGNVNEALFNITNLPVNVTYVYTLTANGCTNTQNVFVTVNPVATVNCRINNTSLTTNFSAVAIPAGKYIWFNSTFDPATLGAGTGNVTVNITNTVITFTANNVQHSLNVPNARIRFDAGASSATTEFINNIWETVVPHNYSSDIFMTGLSYKVPVDLPGNYISVTWKTNINIDNDGVSLGWRWAAAVYDTLANHAGINVKPINGTTLNPYPNTDRAGSPQNFKSFVVAGARGTGEPNYTGSYTAISLDTCSVTAQRSLESPITVIKSMQQKIGELSFDNKWNDKLEIAAMPNPSNTVFSLNINGSNKTPVHIRVTDISGRVIEQYNKVSANTSVKVGQKLSAGSYYVEVIQGDQRKFLKIIKTN